MDYSVIEENGIQVVTIHLKRATADVAKSFKSFLLEIIEDQKKQKIIVDFSEVNFADSSFLGALVSGLKKATEIKGDIKLLGLQPSVRAMFQLTRLYKVFEIFDNKDDAFRSF